MAAYKRWYEWLLSATYSSKISVLFFGPAQSSPLTPNPFQPVVLSNFTQSSRSLSWKRGIWPPSPANYSLFLSPSSSSNHRSTALWPALAQNYEGYFQHCNLKHTWYTHTHTHIENHTLSKYTGRWKDTIRQRRGDTCPQRHMLLHPQNTLTHRSVDFVCWVCAVAQYRKAGRRPNCIEMWKKLIWKQEANKGMLWQRGHRGHNSEKENE